MTTKNATTAELDNAAIKAMESIKALEPKAPKTVEAPKTVDITPILKNFPDTFTPAILDAAFGLNDGGKTVRRHLRKHFAETMEHNHKDKWSFSKTNVDIIQYFAQRYTFNATAINTTK